MQQNITPQTRRGEVGPSPEKRSTKLFSTAAYMLFLLSDHKTPRHEGRSKKKPPAYEDLMKTSTPMKNRFLSCVGGVQSELRNERGGSRGVKLSNQNLSG